MQATFDCLMKTYGFLTPDLWKETRFTKSPFQEYFDILAKPANKVIVYATEEAVPERVEAWVIRCYAACFVLVVLFSDMLVF